MCTSVLGPKWLRTEVTKDRSACRPVCKCCTCNLARLVACRRWRRTVAARLPRAVRRRYTSPATTLKAAPSRSPRTDSRAPAGCSTEHTAGAALPHSMRVPRRLKLLNCALTLLVGRQEGHPACKKTEWWGAGVVICLERRADLHMAQLMSLPLTVSCFSNKSIGEFAPLLWSPRYGALEIIVGLLRHPRDLI